MKTQTKLKIVIVRPVIEALSEIQVTKQTAQGDKPQTKFSPRMTVKTPQKSGQIILMFNLFIKANKGAINFRTNAT